MRWLTRQAPVYYVVDDMASKGLAHIVRHVTE